MKQIQIEEDVFNIFLAKCPSCNSEIIFKRSNEDNGILVKIHSTNEVEIPNMLLLYRACKNPLCEWSKIEVKEIW